MDRPHLWSWHFAVDKHSIVMMTELQNAITLLHAIYQLYIYYCINWLWSIPEQTVEGGNPLNPMVPAHLAIPLIASQGTGTDICGIGSISPNDHWTGLGAYTNWALISNLLLKVWLMVCDTCFVCTDWCGKRWPMAACSFRALVVLCWMLPIFT